MGLVRSKFSLNSGMRLIGEGGGAVGRKQGSCLWFHTQNTPRGGLGMRLCRLEKFNLVQYLVQRVARLKDDGRQEEEEEGGRRELLLILQLIACLLHNPEQESHNNACSTQ